MMGEKETKGGRIGVLSRARGAQLCARCVLSAQWNRYAYGVVGPELTAENEPFSFRLLNFHF